MTELAPANDNYSQAASLLGGEKILKRSVRSASEAHDLLAAGLPGKALHQLVENLTVLKPPESLEKGLGISLRTYQRSRKSPTRPLSIEQSSRTWVFASVLAHAIRALGSRKAAEDWLQRPTYALDHKRPIDLLATHEGVEMVRTLLGRIEYGVYT
jgi:putative toxin-antitoxin system antitoxin component (TIGR02293 family)